MNNKNVYLVGIKGAGMAGLARILKARGYNVSGSDVKEKFFTDALLKKAGIKYFEEFSKKHLTSKIGRVISSNAYLLSSAANPEIKETKKRKIPLVSYSAAAGEIFNKSFGIAVCGTHGKTTTAALIAYILEKAKKDPTALIGGELIDWKSNSRAGKSEYFVLEADEYREQFLNYRPKIIAITGVDYDHPDYFATRKSYKTAFEKFKKNLKIGGKIFYGRKNHPQFSTNLIGKHNQRNIDLAARTAKYLGISDATIKKAVREFSGIRRRLETLGKFNGNIVIDDYAHNPEKVSASLEALKLAYPRKKIIVIFQPHTFSRTEKFLKEFARALIKADEIYLLDVYSSAREAVGKINSDHLVSALKKIGKPAINLKTIPAAVEFLKNKKGNNVLVTMGAGDVFRVAFALLKKEL